MRPVSPALLVLFALHDHPYYDARRLFTAMPYGQTGVPVVAPLGGSIDPEILFDGADHIATRNRAGQWERGAPTDTTGVFVMSRSRTLMLVTLTALLIIGCTSPTVPAPNAVEVRPEPNKAAIVGRLTSDKDGQPVANAVVRLADVYREGDAGAYVLDDALSPVARSEQNGTFVFQNVEPKEYVLVVGNELGNYIVIADTTGNARVWETQADQVLNVGELRIDPEEITP